MPPRLVEVCNYLACGLLRLLSHTGTDVGGEANVVANQGESSLHFAAHQSGHAKPKDKERA